MKTVKSGKELGVVLKGISEMCGDDFADFLKKLTFDGFRLLVRKTAKDTGYARSHWEVAVDETPNNETHKGEKNKKYNQQPMVNVNIKTGSFIILYNNTEYIGYLEHGTPTNRAQPMVAPTQLRLYNIAVKLSKVLTKKVYDV